ncbi:MAG: hypothetical protein JXB23_06050, partial [Candidatus Aminicenantes bacterium]|nr:hypothetical protein [Candidatus Aminicenantes bacterium]
NPKYKIHNRKISQLVRLIDIFPTVLEILDLDSKAEVMGVGLSEIFSIEKEVDLDLLGFSEAILYGAEQKAIQSAHFKFIKRMGTNAFEFYHLDCDRWEKAELQTKKNDFKKLFNEYRYSKSRLYRPGQKDLDEKTKEILKSLGYIK